MSAQFQVGCPPKFIPFTWRRRIFRPALMGMDGWLLFGWVDSNPVLHPRLPFSHCHPSARPGVRYLQQPLQILALRVADKGVGVREIIVVAPVPATTDPATNLLVAPVLKFLLVVLQQH